MVIYNKLNPYNIAILLCTPYYIITLPSLIYFGANLCVFSCLISSQGDSGGPLMIEKDNGRWTLIGTVSHGIKCAAPYLPGVYMRTTYYKPWLQTITGVQ